MKKILVIGEICKDVFNYGKVDKLCPEAPVPIFKTLFSESNLGMAGNVCNNLVSLDSEVEIESFHQSETITKTRFVDKKSNQMIVRVDEGELKKCSPLNLTQSLLTKIHQSDIVIVSDYNKGFLDLDTLKLIGKSSKLSILDSKKQLNDEVVKSFSFVKLNEKEFENNTELTYLENILITIGERGCIFRNKIFESKQPKETIDVSGAGDTFVCSFILKFFDTKNIEKSIDYANEMASIVVGKRGVVTP
jgi:D-beta-D-heptose 7-phosphate kinase/D-beta-D-heptose 1-phosphate adenosyltransferase